MNNKSILRLEHLCKEIPLLLLQINETEFSTKPSPEKWSKKEILGHLIDSAANNHHRFVRCQFEDYVIVPYDQNNWVTYSYYQQIPIVHLVDLWTIYNTHLVFVLKQTPDKQFRKIYKLSDGATITFEYLVEDYIAHLEHHLRQIIEYD